MRIKEIKNLMDEYNIDYWKAAELYEYFERFYYYDNNWDDYMYLNRQSHKWKFEGVSSLHFIIDCLLNSNNTINTIIFKTNTDLINTCPNCGNTVDNDYESYTSFLNIKEAIERLNETKEEIEENEENGLVINVEKRRNIKNEQVLIITVNVLIIKSTMYCNACFDNSDYIPELFFYDSNGSYKDRHIADEFKDHIWSHSFYTGYDGPHTNDELLRRCDGVCNNPEWQICCSDFEQRIGAVGFYLRGYAYYVSNVDLCSYIDNKGNRLFELGGFRDDNLIQKEDEICLDEWDHIEAIVSKVNVLGVWIKDWFLEQKQGRELWKILEKKAIENGWITHICEARKYERL